MSDKKETTLKDLLQPCVEREVRKAAERLRNTSRLLALMPAATEEELAAMEKAHKEYKERERLAQEKQDADRQWAENLLGKKLVCSRCGKPTTIILDGDCKDTIGVVGCEKCEDDDAYNRAMEE